MFDIIKYIAFNTTLIAAIILGHIYNEGLLNIALFTLCAMSIILLFIMIDAVQDKLVEKRTEPMPEYSNYLSIPINIILLGTLAYYNHFILFGLVLITLIVVNGAKEDINKRILAKGSINVSSS